MKAGRVIRLQQFASRDAAVRGSDSVEDAAVAAVRAGDVPALRQLLTDHPSLAAARLPDHGDRTLLHVATDWPGHFPNVRGAIAAAASRIAFIASLIACHAAGATDVIGAVNRPPEARIDHCY